MNKNSYPRILWVINFKNNKIDFVQPSQDSRLQSSLDASVNLDNRQKIQEQEREEFLDKMKERFEEIKKEFSKPEEEAAYLEKVLNVAHNLKNLFELIKELNNLIKKLPPSSGLPPKNPNEK